MLSEKETLKQTYKQRLQIKPSGVGESVTLLPILQTELFFITSEYFMEFWWNFALEYQMPLETFWYKLPSVVPSMHM